MATKNKSRKPAENTTTKVFFFLNLEKTMRTLKHKKNLLLMIRKLQTRNIF